MATAGDLIKGSLRLLGAIATGETPASAELADGLVTLNDMLESWSTENLIVYYKPREEFTLTANDGAYTIGSGGDFDTSRPLEIIKASIEDQSQSPTLEIPIQVITLEQWARIAQKDMTATHPQKIYLDDNFASGLATIQLWPVPTAANKLVLYSRKPLTAFASTATTVTLPPGYSRALKYNLAIDLAAEYSMEPPASVVAIAERSLANIKRRNIKPLYLKCDPATLARPSTFNIHTGEYE